MADEPTYDHATDSVRISRERLGAWLRIASTVAAVTSDRHQRKSLERLAGEIAVAYEVGRRPTGYQKFR